MLQKPEISVWCSEKFICYKLQTPLKCRKTEKKERENADSEERWAVKCLWMNFLMRSVLGDYLPGYFLSLAVSHWESDTLVPTKTDMFLSSGYRGVTAGVTGVLQCQSGSSLGLQFWGKCNFLGGGYSCKTEEVSVSVEMEHSGRTVITVIGHGSACPTFPVVHQFPMIAQW